MRLTTKSAMGTALACCVLALTTTVVAENTAGIVYTTEKSLFDVKSTFPEGVATSIQVLLDETVRTKFESESGVVSPNAPLGRVLLYMTPRSDVIPMRGCDDTQNTVQVFGLDYHRSSNGLFTIDSTILGYPMRSLTEALDAFQTQTVYIQAKLTRYDEYTREKGPAPVLPVSCVSPAGGDGMYLEPEGTVFSDVMKVTLRSRTNTATTDSAKRLRSSSIAEEKISVVMKNVVPAPKDNNPKCAGGGRANSKYIRTVRVKNDRLSKWWNREIYLEACVLLPFGFDEPEHKDAKYPLVVAHGHYSSEWNAGGRFAEQMPETPKKGYPAVDDLYAYYLYKNWTMSDSGPFHGARMLVITVNHPVPFFDDSYAINSANMGPYGDAIVYDIIPEVERQFRGIGEGWARGVFGGSTGGWESLATQVMYPDEFNSAYSSCPDPISFTSFAQVNIYDFESAYMYPSSFKRTPIPAGRGTYDGQIFPVDYGRSSEYGIVSATMEEVNLRELVVGPNFRSCGQWDAWGAVFSPMDDKTGYPKSLYDKVTGDIDSEVAEYWRENYDLLHIMKTNWKTLGPKLVGKLHIYAGASDAFYLNNAVMDVQDFLEQTTAPYYDGEIVIGHHEGRGFSHCFSGYTLDVNGKKLPNAISREIMNQRYLPRMAKHFTKTAPEGADVTSWRY